MSSREKKADPARVGLSHYGPGLIVGCQSREVRRSAMLGYAARAGIHRSRVC